MTDIMSQHRGERLILIYQHLPRGEKHAKTLSQLLQEFNPTGELQSSRSKLLENDIFALLYLLGETAIGRIPDWSDGDIKPDEIKSQVKGKTPKYYKKEDFNLDNESENLFFWEMLDKFTAHYLPKDVHQQLEQKIRSVRNQQKKQYQKSELGQWKNHLITLPSLLQAPNYDNQVLATIHQAIRERKALTFTYRKKWQETPESRTFYPAGLVFVDNMMYLTGFNEFEDSIRYDWLDHIKHQRNFAVNRILSAEIINTPIPDWMEKFTLTFLQKLGKLETHMTYPFEVITLKLKINREAGEHLSERPLADNQIIEPYDDDNVLVTATLTNTQRLEDWLISMSQLSEVLEPLEIRERIIERLENGLNQYRK